MSKRYVAWMRGLRRIVTAPCIERTTILNGLRQPYRDGGKTAHLHPAGLAPITEGGRGKERLMAQNTSNNPSFSQARRNRLTQLGLCDVEVNELEIYLPLCRAILRHPAKLQDVRDEFESLRHKMERAHSAMSKLRKATRLMEAKYEAHQRLIMADEGRDIEKAMQALESACNVVQHAQESLPTEQRRHRDADIEPVRLIDEALLSGFIKRHSTESIDPVTGGRRFGSLPRYTLKRSYSPKSRFRKIVGACYEAMGQRNPDPERAIRAYIAWLRRKDKAKGPAFGLDPSASRTRRQGRKVGR